LLSRLRHGPSREDMERAEAGATYVRQNHTWTHRLEELCAIVKI
jgi:spore maturation protein CgeB